MATYDVRLLDTTYTVLPKEKPAGKDREDIVVKLFGKTRENKSITILYHDFKPYFHLFDPPATLVEELNRSDEVLKSEEVVLEYKGVKEPFLKVTVRIPFQIKKLRNQYDFDTRVFFMSESPPADIIEKLRQEPDLVTIDPNQSGRVMVEMSDRVYAQRVIQKYELSKYMIKETADMLKLRAVFFAADIVYTNRFLYDMDLDTCVRVEGDEVGCRGEHTTDIVLEAKKFEKCDIFVPKLKILSFDIENSIKYGNLYCICMDMLDESTGQFIPKKIVSNFGVRHKDPTREELMAWSADERRMVMQFAEFIRDLDPDVITGYNINNYDLDKMFERACMYFGKPDKKQENTRSVIDILNIGRDAVPMSRREKEGIVNWDVKGRLIVDAWASVRKELHPKRETLGYVSEQLFKDTKDNIDSSHIDDEWRDRKDEVVAYCLKDCELALRILIHPKINSLNKFMDLAIPSHLPVKETSGGQGRMLESVLIRMADKEGFAVPCNNNEPYTYPGAFVVDSVVGLHQWVIGLDFSSMYPSQMIKHNICFSTYAKDRTQPGVHISPPIDEAGKVTAAFVSQDVKYGIIPRMVGGFLDSRKEAKNLMKEARKNGDKDKEEYYDRLQKAVKVMANATYGYFGTQRCRWPYNQYIAPSITAWAREEIHTVKSTLEGEGCTVVAGDTDSVMFTNPKYQNLDAALTYGQAKQKQFSTGGMKIELEKVMATFFTWAKKRYFGKIVWPEEEIITRGAETRRTDSFDLQSETLEEIFKLVLDNKIEEPKKLAKETVQKTLRGEYKWDRFVQAKTVKEFGSYSNADSMAGVQAVKKLMEAGQEFIPGMKYAYIVTNSRVKPIRVEPVIEGIEFIARPDYKYYAERLAKSFGRVTFAFGLDETGLLSSSKQQSLFSFCEEEPSAVVVPVDDEPEEEEENNKDAVGDIADDDDVSGLMS